MWKLTITYEPVGRDWYTGDRTVQSTRVDRAAVTHKGEEAFVEAARKVYREIQEGES